MNAKTLLVGSMCALLAVGIMGCPLAGPLVYGPYKIYFDDNCDDQDDSLYTLYLYGNGTLEYIANSESKSGTWSVDGSTFSMTINDYSNGNDLNGQATIEPNELINGTYTVDGVVDSEGCWRATKVVFESQAAK